MGYDCNPFLLVVDTRLMTLKTLSVNLFRQLEMQLLEGGHALSHFILNPILVSNLFPFAIIFDPKYSCLPRTQTIPNANFKSEWLTAFVPFWQVSKNNIPDLMKYASVHKCKENG